MTQRRARKLPSEAHDILNARGAERADALEKANEELKAAQAELQRRWQYLAEAQRLSHSGTFGLRVSNGERVLLDETYKILGFARETNPTIDLVFDRIHPEDRERLQQLRDRAAQSGMDLDVEHRILLPDGVIRYIHVVAHAGEDHSGNREYIGIVSDITERKRAEEERQALSRELKESNARLEEAQRVAHVGYWEWDLQTGEVIWSDETYRIFGLKPQERPMDLAMVRGMVHPDDREALYSGVDVELAAGVHPVHEHRIVRPSGEVRTVHAITSKLWSALPGDTDNGASGRTRRLFGTVQDITELKRAEETRHTLSQDLQESRAWLEEAQRVAHLGYWVWDLETNRVIWSEETYRIFGLAPQGGSLDIAIIGEMSHPDDREAVFRAAEEAIRSGTRADFEHRLIRPDGEVRIVHSLGDLKKDSGGRPYQMFGTTQDITERKRVEEERETLSNALQQSNARLEEAQRVAHIGHYEWKLLENRVTWSDELYRIYGLPPRKDPIDMATVFEMVHPEERENVAREADEAIRSGAPLNMEHRIVRPDGEVRYVQTLGTAKREGAGRIYEMFGTGQDITERKHAEQALQRSQFYLSEGERLAHMGSWATSDLGIHWSDDLDIYWSDEVYKIFGFDRTKGAPNLQQFFAAIHPQDRDRLAEAMEQLHEQHCGCDITSRIIRPDGEIRYVRCVGIPVVEGGVFKGYHGTTIDVTEHELLTVELRREQAYLAEAQRLAHAGSWASNLVTRQVFHSSEEKNRLYGFDVSQYTNPFDLHYSTILAEDEPALRAKLENAIRAGEDFDLEYRIRRADGAIRFLRGIGHHNPGQDLGEYFGITIDITDRKLVEQEREALSNALQQSNAYLAEAQSLTHVGSWACNLVTQQIFHSSDENARMYGFDPSQGPIPFESFYRTILAEDERAVRAKLEGAISAGEDYDVEFRIRRTDGAI